MIKERVIMIFPKFDNMEIVDRIRRKYDPLAELVLPHITLVFPFKSEISDNEIQECLSAALQGISAFSIKLHEFAMREDRYGNYLFLLVAEGKKEIIELHDKLYQGILRQFKQDYPYEPHMTVGKLQTVLEMNKAFSEISPCMESFEAIVDTISVEAIGENQESIVEIEYELQR